MAKKLSVAFLWHMHQPLYKDFLTGKYHLPWVRLHSTYSYLDMVSVLENFPNIKVTFNFTPSLIWQLLDLSRGEPVNDEYLLLSEKAAKDLSLEERIFILKNFFSCDFNHAIAPMHKYKELFFKRGSDLSKKTLIETLSVFNDSDFRDLQVLFNLAWCGFTLRKKDPLVKTLFKKGSGYTETEKSELLKMQSRVVSSIIPSYKRLQDLRRIEISTSPFYHPIIPLLSKQGEGQGYDFTKDAKNQINEAIKLYEKVFGIPPVGMWPPEGSVSEEAVRLFSDAGVRWIATDEGIVLESFKGQDISREDLIYSSFTAGDKEHAVDMIFRDINLSNAISFRYSNMHYKKAVGEFVEDLCGIHKVMKNKEDSSIAAIILDGENPWPYYANGGQNFLLRMYHKIQENKDMEFVTVGEYLWLKKSRKKIKKLYAGSWIDRNFNKWIGSPQKDKAWRYLEKVRKDVFVSGKPDKKVLEELYIAEGSDWFWWYDDFGTELNYIFDDLFRMHLSNIYTLMGKDVPGYLAEPIPAAPSMQKVPELSLGKSEMVRGLKILFAASEVFPFAKTGGLADVAGSLPRALAALGCDVRVIMPYYKCVKESSLEVRACTPDMDGMILGDSMNFKVYSNRSNGVLTYFVDNDKFFNRSRLYGTNKGDFRDNAIRFSFFSKAVLASLKEINFKPDIIHCNDWQTALIPFYLRFMLSRDDFYHSIKTLYTIHNMAYQGVFKKNILPKVGVSSRFFNMNDLEFYGKVNIMKSGILYSDMISTVSHSYAEEIMTPEYGAGLEGVVKARRGKLYGIPNGVDYSVWSPKTDKFIKVNYNYETLDKKIECKKDLIEYTKLSINLEMPLIGIVTRLVYQKGVDLLAETMNRIVSLNAGVVILGNGNRYYNSLFSSLMARFSKNVFYCNTFNDELAHKIEAGCDMFVMPSRYEPCGLNQMYSIKYGTIPIVRATGGLNDAIVDFDEDREKGNGFKFTKPVPDVFFSAVKRAVDTYADKELWKKLMHQAMKYDFSWDVSAKKYVTLYKRTLGTRG